MRTEPTSPSSSLAERFVCLRRDFVLRGDWARLWLADGGLAASAAPVMALLATRAERPATCSLDRLAGLSGLSKTDLQRARPLLSTRHIISFLESPRRGRWRFAATTTLVALGRVPRCYFPGDLVDTGIWADLPLPARSLLIALAAMASQIRVHDADELDDRLPEELLSRLWEIEAVEDIDSDTTIYEEHWIARRVGVASLDELAGLAGIGAALAGALLRTLARAEDLLVLHMADGEIWYHLPATCWAPRS
jgi:hypothetical protein